MKIKKYNITILLCIFSSLIFSQINDLETKEEELINLAQIILEGANDEIKTEANEKFKKNLFKILTTKKSYKYEFQKIEHISILQPKDKKFKLFTWFLPYEDGTYEYFGFIQQCKKNGKKCTIYNLETINDNDKIPLNKQLKHNEWYGCLYYDIIPIKIGKRTYYTLLGWDGNDTSTTKKIIDVLEISKKKNPFLGSNIFDNQQKRIIIEYSSKYSISLKYDDNLEYIVFDHVEPIDGLSINNFDIYAPNLSYDILKKTNSGWKLEKNIYLNNRK